MRFSTINLFTVLCATVVRGTPAVSHGKWIPKVVSDEAVVARDAVNIDSIVDRSRIG
jgi:hypothetical protein